MIFVQRFGSVILVDAHQKIGQLSHNLDLICH